MQLFMLVHSNSARLHHRHICVHCIQMDTLCAIGEDETEKEVIYIIEI